MPDTGSDSCEDVDEIVLVSEVADRAEGSRVDGVSEAVLTSRLDDELGKLKRPSVPEDDDDVSWDEDELELELNVGEVLDESTRIFSLETVDEASVIESDVRLELDPKLLDGLICTSVLETVDEAPMVVEGVVLGLDVNELLHDSSSTVALEAVDERPPTTVDEAPTVVEGVVLELDVNESLQDSSSTVALEVVREGPPTMAEESRVMVEDVVLRLDVKDVLKDSTSTAPLAPVDEDSRAGDDVRLELVGTYVLEESGCASVLETVLEISVAEDAGAELNSEDVVIEGRLSDRAEEDAACESDDAP